MQKRELEMELVRNEHLEPVRAPSPHSSSDSEDQQEFNAPTSLKALVGYLYFLQGIILSFAGTMPYVYPDLPSYDTLAIFALATIPFSFKFVTAPLVQRVTFLSYGKRKTWIVISQIVSCIFILVSSFFTDLKEANTLAFLFLVVVLCISLQDIALDGLAIKELRTPHLVSMLQAVGQSIGFVLGSLLLLKLTSAQFASKIGLNGPVTTPAVIFRILASIILAPSIVIHFCFRETTLASERKVSDKSLWEVMCYYSVFCRIGSQFCRTALMYLIWKQGFNFFAAGYDYELIKAGFSRDTANTLGNIIVVPVSILSCALSGHIQKFGILKGLMVCMIGREIMFIFLLVVFPTDVTSIAISSLITSILGTWMFLAVSIINNNFPVTGVAGMYLTMLASASNFGNEVFIQTKIIAALGWKHCAIFGLSLELLLIIALPWLYGWVKKGDLEVDPAINEENQELAEEELSPRDKEYNQVDPSSKQNNKFSFRQN